MKSLAYSGLAQGAGSDQKSHVSTLGSFTLKIALSLILMFSTSFLGAQQLLEENVENFDFSVNVPLGQFQIGDVVQVDFVLGNTSNPVKDVAGFEFWIDLGGDAIPAPNHPEMGFEGSTLVSNGAADGTATWDPTNRLYTINALLGFNQTGTATGKVVSIWIEITSNNFIGASLGARAGGLAMIENISGKWAPEVSPLASQAQIFPIPATSNLQIQHPAAEPMVARLMALDGRLLSEFTLSPQATTSIDVNGLPRGLSLLVFEDGSHKRIVLK